LSHTSLFFASQWIIFTPFTEYKTFRKFPYTASFTPERLILTNNSLRIFCSLSLFTHLLLIAKCNKILISVVNTYTNVKFLQMSFLSRFEQFFIKVKQNRWIWLFSIFCRVTLAIGFLAGGYVKIIDERFASGLSIIHPMGSYLDALHQTEYYYTFIGIIQILAAVLLLIARTVFLEALLISPLS